MFVIENLMTMNQCLWEWLDSLWCFLLLPMLILAATLMFLIVTF